ncbi:MAG TPA: alpha/beta hydrolase [Gaiellaceae bacterium]
MGEIEVAGGSLYVEEAGDGPAVVLVHGGLGDRRLWDEQMAPFAERFRVVRFDLRGFGRSSSAPGTFGVVDDVVAVLDALGIARAALVGLSFGGRIAIDAALELPDRVWALVAVAAAASGVPLTGVYTDEQDTAFEEALERGDLETAAAIDLAVWAPLGADERIRTLLLENLRTAEGVEERWPEPPAATRLAELRVPTLVVTAARDPARMGEIGDLLEREVPGARRVELDSDHYLPLREPETFNRLVLDFLASAAPDEGQ